MLPRHSQKAGPTHPTGSYGRASRLLKRSKGEIVGQRRLASIGKMVPAKRFEAFTVTRETTGTIEAMPHWAGESVCSVEKIQPAAAIIKELVSEAERLLRSWK